MEISLKNISYYEDGRHVLKDVSCILFPNQVTCVMGMSGSGKTALIDTLVGRRHDGDYSGTISVNGGTMKHTNIAYCQNVDVHLAEFTVMQHLHYACQLRLGNTITPAEREAQCRLTATAVGLDSILDSVVGVRGEPLGISDGERKLLSIAIELVGVPPVLCLDAPLAGLDTASTTRIASVLKSLAHHHKKTIFYSVSQPSDMILTFCDNLLLLSNGEVVYYGQVTKLNQYLSTVATVPIPEDASSWSPMESVFGRLSNPRLATIYISTWRDCDQAEWQSTEYHVNKNPVTMLRLDEPLFNKTTTFLIRRPENENSFAEQLYIFAKRHAHYKLISETGGVKTILGRFIFAGVLFGFTFKNVGQKVKDLGPIFNHSEHHLYAAVYNLLGLMFCYSVFVTVSNFLPIPSLFDMRRFYELEMANRLYHPIARWLAVLVIDIPLVAFGTCLYVLTSGLMIKPNGDMIDYYLLISLASVIGFSYANLCVEVSRTLRTSILLFGMSAALAIWFSGYSISTEDLMNWISWSPKCSHLYWVTGSLMHEEFSFLPQVQRDFILKKYKYENMSLSDSYRSLVLSFVVLQMVLLFLILRPPSSKSQYHKLPTPPIVVDDELAPTAPLIKKNSFLLTSEEEDMVNDFYGPRDSGSSCVEIYRSPTLTEHTVANKDRAILNCRRFTYRVQQGRPWARKKVALLNGVNLVVLPGELCAIMGPIGAGKTTLLKAIAGHTSGGTIEGSIRINGYAVGEHASRTYKVPLASYISSVDTHYPLLTVRETLEYAALLRLRCSNVKSVCSIVERTLLLLDLEGIAECKVGCDDHPSISRGQIRRLTIGCGIVHNASLLLLDQPTCALDAYLSTAIVDMLRTLADTGRTVLCTLHAPSHSDFNKFDKVVLLNHGYVVYFGPVSECEQYFRNLESHMPAVPIVNVADYVLDATARLSLENEKTTSSQHPSVEQLADVIAAMCDDLLANHIIRPSEPIQPQVTTNWIWGNFHLAYILLKRDLLKEYRRMGYWVMHFARCVALGLFLGIVFYDLDHSDEFGRMALFLQVYVVSSLWISELLPDIHIEKSILLQERASNATNSIVSLLVLGFPVTLNLVISSISFSIPIYYMTNLRNDAKHFTLFVLILYIATLGNLFMAYAVAFFTKSYLSSVTIYPGVVGMQTFYCGYSVIISSLATWFRWGASVNPGTYAMAAWFQNELKNNDFKDYEEFADFFEWDKTLESCLIYLLSFIIVNKLLLYLAMNVMKLKQ